MTIIFQRNTRRKWRYFFPRPCTSAIRNETVLSVPETNEGRSGRIRNDWRLGTKSAGGVDVQPERKQQ